MRYTIFFCLFLSLTFSRAFAQEDIIQNHSALQFYFVNGYAVSYKLPTTGLLKYRITLDLGAGYGYATGEDTQESYIRSETDNSRNISVTLTPQAYIYILNTEYANIYTGGGIFINYHYWNQKDSFSKRDLIDTTSTISTSKYTSYSFGLSALLGIQVKLTKNVIAFAESQLNGGRSWNSYKSDFLSSGSTPSWDNNSDHGWFLDYSTIRMGIGIYF